MVDIDELAARAVAQPPSLPRPVSELAARVSRRRQRRRVAGIAAGVVVVATLAAGIAATGTSGRSGTDDVTVGDAGPDGRLALDALLDRPAEPEDAFPEAFSREWGWDPDDESFPIYRDLDFAASRSVTSRPGVPAFAVPTADRDGVCLFLTHAPPEWFPEIDSVIPVRCADAATFNRDGITLRTCGPADVWVTMALVPVGLDPADVEPYGTLHPSGAAVLLDGDGPDEPVELAYAPRHTVRLHGAPFGTQPEDGSVPCPIP
jgi:hypothetical protein